jgi:hypothetical protein
VSIVDNNSDLAAPGLGISEHPGGSACAGGRVDYRVHYRPGPGARPSARRFARRRGSMRTGEIMMLIVDYIHGDDLRRGPAAGRDRGARRMAARQGPQGGVGGWNCSPESASRW